MSDVHALAVIPTNGADTYRMSTDAAHLCASIVKATAQTIQGKKYVRVEGWQSIAVAHGCAASARGVEIVEGGIRAVGEVRRMDTGAVIAEAEGFVGDDEKMWASRPMYARRAMAQTRAISRACRSAFAHVVVMIDKDLSTTPAEEVPPEGFGYTHEAAAQEAHRDGLTTSNKSAYRVDKEKKVTQWVDDAIQTMKLSGQSRESLKAFFAASSAKIAWMEENLPPEYERFLAAYDAALDAALAAA